MFGSNAVKISLGTQIQIRVCGPQTGRQSGKKFDTAILWILAAFNIFAALKNAQLLLPGFVAVVRPQRLWSDHWTQRLAETEGDTFSTFL